MIWKEEGKNRKEDGSVQITETKKILKVEIFSYRMDIKFEKRSRLL